MVTAPVFTGSTVMWMAPAEYAEDRRLGIATVYRRLKAGQIPGAEQVAERHTWRIPVHTGSDS